MFLSVNLEMNSGYVNVRSYLGDFYWFAWVLVVGLTLNLDLLLAIWYILYNFERQFQAFWTKGADVVQRCRDNRVCNWMGYLNWFPYFLQKYTPRVGHSLHLQCWGWITWNRDHVYWWNREAEKSTIITLVFSVVHHHCYISI